MAHAVLTPKRDQSELKIDFILHATLNEILKAKNIGNFSSTTSARPKSEIYTPKRDDEHPRLFHIGVPSPAVANNDGKKLT